MFNTNLITDDLKRNYLLDINNNNINALEKDKTKNEKSNGSEINYKNDIKEYDVDKFEKTVPEKDEKEVEIEKTEATNNKKTVDSANSNFMFRFGQLLNVFGIDKNSSEYKNLEDDIADFDNKMKKLDIITSGNTSFFEGIKEAISKKDEINENLKKLEASSVDKIEDSFFSYDSVVDKYDKQNEVKSNGLLFNA